MKIPDMHPDEEERQRILESLALVFSPAEERFDRITRLTQRMFNVRSALISLVTADRQWFKSNVGLDATETPREISFCGHAILEHGTFVVNDAREHPDFSDNPLVTGPPFVRFYAGQPLRVKGQPIGTLCIVDDKPREFSQEEMDSLQSLATLAEVECAAVALSESQQELLDESEERQRALLIDPASQCWKAEALKYMLPREIALSNRSRDSFSYLHLQIIPDPVEVDGLSEADANRVLRESAKRIKRSLRPYDLVARIDVARFAIFAPSCSADVSELLAERIRARVADSPFDATGGRLSFDLKVGIASAQPGEDATPARLQKVANLALEDAIETGETHVRLMI